MKKLILCLSISITMTLGAELTNIQKGEALVLGFKYSQELRVIGYDKNIIDDLCQNQIEKDKKNLENKPDAYIKIILDKCVESLKTK